MTAALATAPTMEPVTTEPQSDDGLTFGVAKDLREVIAAWRVVYDVYLRSGFIHPNPYLIHTSPQMISQCSAVFHSRQGGQIESTLTAVVDGKLGLPLDSVYKPELDMLRARGKRLTEYGLFAHVRQLAGEPEAQPRTSGNAPDADAGNAPRRGALDARVNTAIVELMRLAFYFALTRNSTDFVIGVHPRHAKFYTRAFGFHPFGDPKTYAAVNHRPVVLLHGNLEDSLAQGRMPHALDYCLSNPVSMDMFDDRFSFNQREIAAAPIRLDAYLREKQRKQFALRRFFAGDGQAVA